jgi:Ran GTPase-activating protein (RanGAP) involved in mRNA processing and transport
MKTLIHYRRTREGFYAILDLQGHLLSLVGSRHLAKLIRRLSRKLA